MCTALFSSLLLLAVSPVFGISGIPKDLPEKAYSQTEDQRDCDGYRSFSEQADRLRHDIAIIGEDDRMKVKELPKKKQRGLEFAGLAFSRNSEGNRVLSNASLLSGEKVVLVNRHLFLKEGVEDGLMDPSNIDPTIFQHFDFRKTPSGREYRAVDFLQLAGDGSDGDAVAVLLEERVPNTLGAVPQAATTSAAELQGVGAVESVGWHPDLASDDPKRVVSCELLSKGNLYIRDRQHVAMTSCDAKNFYDNQYDEKGRRKTVQGFSASALTLPPAPGSERRRIVGLRRSHKAHRDFADSREHIPDKNANVEILIQQRWIEQIQEEWQGALKLPRVETAEL